MSTVRPLAVFLVLLSAAVSAQASPSASCTRVPLTHRPTSANSGAWAPNGDLLIADPWEKEVLRYTKEGHFKGNIPEPIGTTLGEFLPQLIRSHQDRLYLEVMGTNLIVLDQNFTPKLNTNVHVKSVQAASQNLRVEGMFLWEPVGNDVISFSDLHDVKRDTWSSAFVRFPADRPQNFTVLQGMPYEDPSRLFYRLAMPYIASLGETGYILKMDKRMEIDKTTKNGLERIAAFPPGLDLSPDLPSFDTFEDLVPVMKAVEKSTMPTGLYGWENALYVLWRKAEKTGTRWFLTKIDPDNQRVVGTVSIAKTRANHLSVAPGPNSWAFIEKGPVRDVGNQDIGSVLVVPSARVREAFRNGAQELCP